MAQGFILSVTGDNSSLSEARGIIPIPACLIGFTLPANLPADVSGGGYWDSSASLKHVPYSVHPADDFTLRIALMDQGRSHQRKSPLGQSGLGGIIFHHAIKVLSQ